MFSLSYFFLHRSWGMVKTPMLSSSHDLWLSTDLIGFASGWIERQGWDFVSPLWAWICLIILELVGIKRIGLVETIYCLKSLYIIIILMKSLCCLPKCGVNSQVSLLFIVCTVQGLFLGFLISVLKNPQYNSSWGK